MQKEAARLMTARKQRDRERERERGRWRGREEPGDKIHPSESQSGGSFLQPSPSPNGPFTSGPLMDSSTDEVSILVITHLSTVPPAGDQTLNI
jgi:hypothetical protein